MRRALAALTLSAALLVPTAVPTPLDRPAHAQAIQDMAEKCRQLAEFAADTAVGKENRNTDAWRKIYDEVFHACLRLNVGIPPRMERRTWRFGMAPGGVRPGVGGGYVFSLDDRRPALLGWLVFADARIPRDRALWWVGRSGDWHHYQPQRTTTNPGWNPYTIW